jgi:riboflavin biosynthesis pyrimidine reductase
MRALMIELTPSELFEQDTLVDLARRTAPHGVLSVYVHADTGADPGLQGAAIDLKNRLSELERNVAAEGPRERAEAVRDGIRRLAGEIERLTDPQQPGRGRALFAPLGDGEPIRLSSQMALPNRVVLDDRPFVHPLLELLDEGRPAGVVLVSQDEARMLEWRLGELRELERLEAEVTEAPHERSGPVGSPLGTRSHSPMGEQRQAREREMTRRFLEQVADTAARLAAEHGWERVLVSGGERLTEPAIGALRLPAHVTVVRDPRVLTQLDHASLSAKVTEQLHAHHEEHEARLVARARDAALGSGAGALGLSEVAGALNEGRVAHLIYDPEIRYEGGVDADGRLLAAGESSPGGASPTPDTRLTERLVERALETGARVTPVEGASRAALAEAEGIAALLRW